jgi:hypothetical protein
LLAEDAGAEVVAGVDEELSDPELDFAPSVEEPDEESLLPSLEPEEPSLDALSDFGADADLDG